MHLDIPIWGLFAIATDIQGGLAGSGIERVVNIPKIVTGNFKLCLNPKNQDIELSYSLKTEYVGQLDETGFGFLCLTECVKFYVISSS